ncbi:MAG: lysostaphin resistance A-like protein [Salinivirgaceae bacterium]
MENQFDAKDMSPFGQTLILLFIAILLTLLSGLLINLLVRFVPLISDYSILLNYLLSFGSFFFVVRFLWQIDRLDTNKLPFSAYLILLPAILSLLFLTEALVSLIPMPKYFEDLFSGMISLDLKGYLTVGIAAPILEEFIFRGLILKGLLQRYQAKKAIIWSAVIFGVIHLNPWQFVPAFIIGLFIGWIYWKTQSVWPGVFIHFVNNSFSFYVGYRFQDINTSFSELLGGGPLYVFSLLIALVVCWASFKWIQNYFKENCNLIQNQ